MRTPDLRYASFYPVPNIGLLPAGSNLKYNTVKGFKETPPGLKPLDEIILTIEILF